MTLAGGGGPEGVLREIQVSLLECKVCFEKFSRGPTRRRPQNLSCGHVLCLDCVSALTRPGRRLECPFCRQLCGPDGASHCQVVADLQEILLTAGPARPARPPSSLKPASLRLLRSSGGWGTLVNPTGMAALGSSTVVVHDGERRVVVLGQDGRPELSFGSKEEEPAGVRYPVDVAVTGGNVAVTDAGDRALKVFTSRGTHLLSVRGHFLLPWGVDATRDGHLLVSDMQAGTLSLVKLDVSCGALLECGPVLTDLQSPRSVACCRGSGLAAVVEHLEHGATRLTVLSEDFQVLHRTDGLGLMLHSSVPLHVSAVTFDPDGGLLLIDADHGAIWSLEQIRGSGVHLTPVVGQGLVRPVAAVIHLHKLVVLDAGDHTLKTFSSCPDMVSRDVHPLAQVRRSDQVEGPKL